MRHGTPEGNSSSMQIVDLLRSGTLPDDQPHTIDYQPEHAAQETHPLTDRPTPDCDDCGDPACPNVPEETS